MAKAYTQLPAGLLHTGATELPKRCNSDKKHIFQAGQMYGFLTVISVERVPRNPKGFYLCCKCKCRCGNETLAAAHNIVSGHTTSCGCFKRELIRIRSTTHGGSVGRKPSPTYNSWSCMIQRCTNLNNPDFKNYGGRGITVCERWRRFENFLADMGERPPGLTIERINNNGNYEPGNCKWDTRTVQRNNTRRNRILIYNGKSQCTAFWSIETGLPRQAIYNRVVVYGWTVERALTTPLKINPASTQSARRVPVKIDQT